MPDLHLVCSVRDETLDFLFCFIPDGFHSYYVPIFSSSPVNERFGPARALGVGNIGEQFGRDKYSIGAVQRRHQDDARRLRLIMKPFARGSKYKQQDERDNYVVLPGSSGEIPKNQPLPKSCGTRMSAYFGHHPEFSIAN